MIAFHIIGQQVCVAQSNGAGPSTSPLAILESAPKVRFDDPAPTPQPVPYVAPRQAPPVQPVAPAFTPYAGTRSSGQPQYGQSAPGYIPARATPTMTPRPVLGPEDVKKKEKKRGFMRGLIHAIPFVGGDDDEEEKVNDEKPKKDVRDENGFMPLTAPGTEADYETPSKHDENMYRGYEPAKTPTGGELLRPPGSAPIQDNYPADPEPSSPPIMTPEPRFKTPVGGESNADDTMPADNAFLLTVKTESDTSSSESGSANTNLDEVPVSPGKNTLLNEEKRPSISPTIATPTPKPLERATTGSGVLIQESRPVDDDLGPEPDASASTIKPFDPLATPAATQAADIASSLTIKQSDLGMPNPTYEQNAAVLAEFQEAVRKARVDDYETAARLFREYAQNHPASGLAPRAYFLSIVFEKNRIQARENREALKRLFPESRYVKAVEERRPDLSASAVTNEEDTLPNETEAQKTARLEKELTLAIGKSDVEPVVRLELGQEYLSQEKYDRAYEVLRPAVEMSADTAREADVLLVMGRVLVAKGETVQAISLYESVEEKSPASIFKDPETAWNVGLAYEGGGRYSKARSIYNTIRQRWPATTEAGWASKRLTDLAALRQ